MIFASEAVLRESIGQHLYGFVTSRIQKTANLDIYAVLTLEKEVKWWSLPSAAIVIAYKDYLL